MSLHVFAGPTLPGARIRALCPHAVLHPPVRHGDLLRLNPSPKDTVVLIDGLWHQSAPIRHKEILVLLADGVHVIGTASMGALRAAELAPYGMVGVGRIFEAFHTGALDADDEVAVLQGPDGTPLTIALVNVRAALQRAHAAHKIAMVDAYQLLHVAHDVPYTRRTWAALGRAAHDADLAGPFGELDRWRRDHPYDLKREDAEHALALLAADPAQVTRSTWAGEVLHSSTCRRPVDLARPHPDDRWEEEAWRTSFVRYWTCAFQPGPDHPVPLLAALQHQQLYDPAFPARWRRRVLARIARRTASAKSGALAVADASGVDTADMTGEQLSFWLTPYEQGDLSRTEALAKIMVRSARLDGAWSVWPAGWTEAADLLEDAAATVAAVTAAYRTNAEVEAAEPRHSIAHLSPDRIAAHLAIRWGLRAGAGQAERDAAARDRAFRDFAGAIEVARAFYLRASLDDAGSAARDSPRI